jgi:ATP-binding cassette subfamily G (WHITE) protein 2 (SNQ2)
MLYSLTYYFVPDLGITGAKFASAFLASQISVVNRMDMDAYFKECVGHPERALAYKQSGMAEHATAQRKGGPYTISIPMQARAIMLRRLQILRSNLTTQLIILMYARAKLTCCNILIPHRTFIIQALINGSIFFRLKDETSAYFSRGGILFLYVIISCPRL